MAIEQNGKTFTLKGLAPNATYIVQVQAVPKKGKPSAWSQPVKFRTNGKDVAPPAITNLVASFDGNGFNASWDGSAAQAEKDFANFRITITSSLAPSVTKIYDQTSSEFRLDYDSLLFAFLAVVNTLTIEVKSVDRSGNVSSGVSLTVGNSPPAAPTNVAVVAEIMGYQVSWDAPTETDYSYTKIYEASTVSGTYNHIDSVTATPSSIKVVTYDTRYIKVSHVDTFGGESDLAPAVGLEVTPLNPVTVDTTPPDQRTSISYTAGVGQITVSWVNPTDSLNNSDLAGVTIRYARISDPTNYIWLDIPFTFSSPLTSAVINDLLPLTAYNVSISTYDKTQNRTAYSTSTQVLTLADTTPPPRPVAPIVAAGSTAGGPMMVRVTQDALQHSTTTALPQDTYYFKVFMLNAGQTSAPLPGVTTNTNATEIGLIFAAFNGGTSQERFYVILTSGEQRYFYTRAVDTSGNVGDASLATQSTAMTIFDNAHISDLSADKITTGTLTAGRWIDVGPTSSNRIRIENISGGVGKIFSGTGVYSGSTTGFYMDSDGKLSLKDRLTWNPSGIDPITGSTTGLLTIKGSIEAQSGSFTGNVKVENGGSIFVGNSASSGARVVMNSTGLAFFDATSTNNNTGVKLLFNTSTGALTINGYIAVGGAEGDITEISGNKVRTGSIESVGYVGPVSPSQFASVGAKFDLANSEIRTKNFYSLAGSAGFLGSVTSTGLIVQSASTSVSYTTWSGGSMVTPSPAPTTALQADSGADIILGTVSGSLDPSKIRWIYNGQQRSSIGFEVSDYQDGSNYPNTLVIRSHAVPSQTAGKILINAQNGGTIELKGNVTINGSAVETPQSVINRFRNYTDSSQGKPNNITYSTGNPVTVSGVTINGDLHFKY